MLICHKCMYRSCGGRNKPPCTGVMLCTVNKADIIDNIRDGCPLKLFGANAESPGAEQSPLMPVARAKWPKWANWISSFAAPEDIGIGDTVHRKFGTAGEWTKAILKAAGVPCGCDARRERWNKLYPYKKVDPAQ